MKHFSLFAPVILLSCIVCSCDKTEDQSLGGSLRIAVNSEENLTTKAMLYSNATFDQSIGVAGFYGTEQILDGTASKGTTYWETSRKYSFNTAVTLGLYAYYPSTLSLSTTASTGLAFSHTVPDTAAGQTDVMLGYSSESVSKTDMTVDMTLKHALTSVTFKYGDVPTSNFAVTGITISGVYSGADCSFDGTTISWNTTGSSTKSVTGETSVAPAKDSNLGDSATFTLVPQSSFKPTITVSYTYKSVTMTPCDYTPADNISWERGKTYTFAINYDPAKNIDLTVTAVDFNGGNWYTHGSDNVNAGNLTGENW